MVSLDKGVGFVRLIQLFLFVIFFLFLREASGQTSPGNLVEEAKKEGKVTFYTPLTFPRANLCSMDFAAGTRSLIRS